MEEFAFQRALAAIWELIGSVNRYVDAMAPWALAKDPAKRDRLATVLYTLGEALRGLGILLDPFLPDAAAKIRGAVGAPAPSLADLGWGRLVPGTPVTKLSGLFPRIDVGATPGPAAPRRRPAAPKAEAGRRRLPSTSSRRWSCASPKCSPPRRLPSPRSSSS